MARADASDSGSSNIFSIPVGPTCHERPNPSWSQPHCYGGSQNEQGAGRHLGLLFVISSCI